jgi:hypothetical protein
VSIASTEILSDNGSPDIGYATFEANSYDDDDVVEVRKNYKKPKKR